MENMSTNNDIKATSINFVLNEMAESIPKNWIYSIVRNSYILG